jgi:hypothetical protein
MPIHELPCPQCGDPHPIAARDLRPGTIFLCLPCRCHLVVSAELTLARATNDDLFSGRRSIRAQETSRIMLRIWAGMPLDVHC